MFNYRDFSIEMAGGINIPLLAYIPEPWPALIGLVSAFLVFVILTGFHTYFFHPRALSVVQQNRAVALAYYACAPLAFLWPTVVVVLLLSLAFALLSGPSSVPETLMLWRESVDRAWILLVPLIVEVWQVPWGLLKRTTHCSTTRVATGALVTPVAIVILGGLAFVGPAVLAFYVVLVYESLH